MAQRPQPLFLQWGYPSCNECGYSWQTSYEDALRLIETAAARYGRLLEGHADAKRKPDPQTWSPSGYVWHLSDWFRIQGQRIYAIDRDLDYVHVALSGDPQALGDMFHYDELSTPAGLWALGRSGADFVAAATDARRDLVFRAGDDAWTVEDLVIWVGHEVIHHELDIKRGLGIAATALEDHDHD